MMGDVERCAECGFDYASVAAADLPARLRAVGPAMRARLGGAGRDAAVLSRRPAPDVWSAIEYAGHVRDVLLAQRERVLLALVEDRPSFASIHRDARVDLVGYATEAPGSVAGGVDLAAGMLARVFERCSAAQLARRCVYVYPEPAERDVLWVGRHTVHEAEHHLGDVDRVLAVTGG